MAHQVNRARRAQRGRKVRRVRKARKALLVPKVRRVRQALMARRGRQVRKVQPVLKAPRGRKVRRAIRAVCRQARCCSCSKVSLYPHTRRSSAASGKHSTANLRPAAVDLA
jgi:hypothetical protein